jgi:glycerol-3-phosphate dehydrogenase subunit C
MTVHPKDPKFWQKESLQKELMRVWDICHGCRLCFNLCPSFGNLFKYIDEKDGEVKDLSRVELNHVTDLCYQCKLCFVKCPYTPPHQWEVDVPRLLMRDKAVRAKNEGISTQDRFFSNPDRTAKLGCKVASLSNWANQNPTMRKILEQTVGLHRDRNVPPFQRPTFEQWLRQRKNPLKSEKKVAFFYTCFINYNDRQQGIAAVDVLEKNGYEVVTPKQVCCGMPFIDSGDLEGATNNMEQNIENFQQAIDAGLPIVAPGPTCSYVLKNEFAYLTQNPAAQKMGKQTRDLSEFLVELKSRNELNKDFKETPSTKIAYQIPCHLRAQNIGYKSMELLRAIPNVKVELVEHCSAMDGTWGMKKQFFELSLKQAKKVFREVDQATPDTVCTDCPLSALQIEYGTKKKPVHPVEVLHRAYGFTNE